jgi:DNA processing protein
VQDTALTAVPALSSSPARLAAWLRLERCAGIGPRTAAALLDVFGSPDAVFAADVAALAAHVSPAQARALLQPPADTTRRLLDATLAWLDRPGHGVLALGEPGYPELLSHIPDPPLLLYIRGRAALLAGPSLAIVGSRNASVQGRMNAQAFAHSLSAAGLCIVSGLALGIDAAAHEGALRCAGGTVAVVGTGPDVVYPARNRALGERIAAEGCIVSEYPVGTPPLPGNFPRRNRIISGLAAGVLVVEAAAQSGSLITARQAAEQGRDVFAIPGSIHAALAKGCHVLIREGAKLVDTAQDVLEALASSPLLGVPAAFLPASVISLTDMNNDNSPAVGVGTPAEAALLAALGHDPVDMDVLLARLGCPPGELSAQLLVLELAGRVERLPGGRVQRIFKR